MAGACGSGRLSSGIWRELDALAVSGHDVEAVGDDKVIT
jgi:hypothetical protein